MLLGEFVQSKLYSGIKTGLNEAFVVDETVYQSLVNEHPSSSEIMRPTLRGQDLRPWYHQQSGNYLILAKQGINIDEFPAIKQHLQKYRERLENRTDTFNAWYELRPCDYYDEFDGEKVIWSDISKLPRFSWDTGTYLNNTGFFISGIKPYFLSLVQSRTFWFILSQIAQPLRLRGGLWQYRVIPQFVERLPIPQLTTEQESRLAAIAEEITGLARSRYKLHEDLRQTLSGDFGNRQPISTRVGLYQWWELEDEKAVNDEIRRQFGSEIPLKKRPEWRSFLEDQKAEHYKLTQQIIDLEIRMNDIVYDVFNLTSEERQLIEQTTKYPYGEV